jgi:hypothetical protein
MMLKIKNHFKKFNLFHFTLGVIVSLIVLDLINFYYLSLYWTKQNLSLLYVQRLSLGQGLDVHQLSTQSIQEIKQVIDNSFFLFLVIVLINNLFFYIFYFRNKLWAQSYVLFYTLSNSVLAVLFLVEGPILGIPWFIYNLVTIFLYIYLYLGIKFFKDESMISNQTK